jgi:pyruvate dehydrogenase E1 component beta subunit
VRRIGGTFSAVPFASHLEQAWIPQKSDLVAQIKASVGKV